MIQATLLALIAGYADAIGYMEFHAFAGLMTGNTIFAGIELATARYAEAAFHISMIGVFLIGVIFARVALRGGLPVWIILSVTSVLLVICSFISAEGGALLLATAMGIQNSAANRFGGIALNTTFITGNLQKLGEEIVHWLWPHETAAPQGARIFAAVWFAYAVGAFLGAYAHGALSRPLFIPAALLPFVMLRPRGAK